MNKLRAQYLYRLVATIQKKKSRTSPKGQFYQLQITCSNLPITKIFVFDDKLTNPNIWTAITEDNCFNTKYLLYCRNYQGYYYLVDWKELVGSFDKGSAKELKNGQNPLKPKNHEKD